MNNEQDQPVTSGEWTREMVRGLLIDHGHSGYQRIADAHNRALAQLRQPVNSGEVACENTDKELWRERAGDFYADSIHVTKQGGIGINCGGTVFVKPLRAWHQLALAQLRQPVSGTGQESRLDAAEEALRLICVRHLNFDPSDGEGTMPHEVVEMLDAKYPQPVSAEADEIAREAATELNKGGSYTDLGTSAFRNWAEQIIRDAIARTTAAKDAEIARLNEACSKEFASVEELSHKLTAAEEQREEQA